MNEDKLKTLLQQDINLRDAIRQEEAERPQMPADLNARLMKRVAKEKKQKHARLWPWIAAACVAGIMVVFLTSPKDTIEEKAIVAKVEKKAVEKKKDTRPETPVKEVKKAKPATPIKRQPQQRKPITPAAAPKPLLAQKSAPVKSAPRGFRDAFLRFLYSAISLRRFALAVYFCASHRVFVVLLVNEDILLIRVDVAFLSLVHDVAESYDVGDQRKRRDAKHCVRVSSHGINRCTGNSRLTAGNLIQFLDRCKTVHVLCRQHNPVELMETVLEDLLEEREYLRKHTPDSEGVSTVLNPATTVPKERSYGRS